MCSTGRIRPQPASTSTAWIALPEQGPDVLKLGGLTPEAGESGQAIVARTASSGRATDAPQLTQTAVIWD
jgi:hypothetical protein